MNEFKEKINICFDDRIFSPVGLGAINYGAADSLSQIVANSLDWRQFSNNEILFYKKLKKTNPEKFLIFLKFMEIH